MKKFFMVGLVVGVVLLSSLGCNSKQTTVEVHSDSGVNKAHVDVVTGPDGLTAEQRNIRDRLKVDNTPGAIKHLYIFSAYSGQCLFYSTVREKVTSSGKRLNPNSFEGCWTTIPGRTDYQFSNGIPHHRKDGTYYTKESLQDDGTYGSSIEYLYWFDQNGKFHQHYLGGGQIVHVSNEPISVKSVTVNLEIK